MAVGLSWGGTGGSGYMVPVKPELCVYETGGTGGGGIEGCGFNFVFLFGEAWEAGE